MHTHPLDVMVLFPAFADTLIELFEVLSAHGLEVYPHEGQWFWRWRSYSMEATSGATSMGEAVAAALTFRLQMPSAISPPPLN